uniref:Uncharacterized protein n=1 Tax=Physcomitrium patens TaxID=3218 RepID=A0A2K1L908_PHYPA|nr:hypothetical protein PHYPA_000931 [Physcomitrium patens]
MEYELCTALHTVFSLSFLLILFGFFMPIFSLELIGNVSFVKLLSCVKSILDYIMSL